MEVLFKTKLKTFNSNSFKAEWHEISGNFFIFKVTPTEFESLRRIVVALFIPEVMLWEKAFEQVLIKVTQLIVPRIMFENWVQFS